MTSEIFALTLAVVVGLILAYPLGYLAGKARGEAEGWRDGYFEKADEVKARAQKKLRNFRGGKGAA